MKQLLLLLCSALTISAGAQPRYFIGMSGGMDYAYRTSSGDAGFKKGVDASEVGSLGFRLGADMGIRLRKSAGTALYLKSGIRYVQTGFQTKKEQDSEELYDPATGTFIHFLGGPRFRYRYHYLELPLALRYQLGNRRLSFFIEGGFTGNVYLGGETIMISDGSRSIQTMRNGHYNKLLLGAYLSAGVQYRINSRVQVFLQPIGRYSLTPMNNDPMKYYPYTIGGETGLRCGFH